MSFYPLKPSVISATKLSVFPFYPNRISACTCRDSHSESRISVQPLPLPDAEKSGLLYQFLYRVDGSLTFIFLSPNYYEFFQISEECLGYDSQGFYHLLHPEDHNHFHQSIAEAAKQLTSWRWIGRYLLPSGKTKHLQWDAQPSLQANGNIFWHGSLVEVRDSVQD